MISSVLGDWTLLMNWIYKMLRKEWTVFSVTYLPDSIVIKADFDGYDTGVPKIGMSINPAPE